MGNLPKVTQNENIFHLTVFGLPKLAYGNCLYSSITHIVSEAITKWLSVLYVISLSK